MTGYLSDEVRAVILSVIMVLSVFGGTVAFSGTAVAATPTDGGSGSVSPSTVDEQSTNTFSITANIADVDTIDGNDQRVEVNFPSQLTVTTDSSVENIVLSDTAGDDGLNVSDTVVNSGAGGSVEVLLADNASGTASTAADEPLTIELDVTDVDATSVSGTDGDSLTGNTISYDFENQAGDDQFTGGNVGDVQIDNVDTLISDTDTIFVGQESIEFTTGDTSLTGIGGDAEGRVISSPISPNAVPGQYSDDGTTNNTIQVTLDEPRISDYEIRNPNDEDISGGSVAEANADNLEVFVEYNFDQYEDAEITVDDQDGLEITDDVITTTNPAGGTATGTTTQTFGLNLDGQDAGTYTITAEGDGDFDFGQASQSATLDLTSEENVGVELASDTVTQGDNLRYDVVGGVAGDSHIVQINDTDFNDNADDFDIGTIFRNVEDVEERGIVVGNNFHEVSGTATDPSIEGVGDDSVPVDSIDAAYAVVTIDDDTGLGVGSIDSTALDDTSVTIEVSDLISGTSPGGLGDDDGTEETISVSGDRITDDADFDVEEGTLTLDSPGQTYVVGSEVDVNGTASTGIDEVAIYVRDEDDFELVPIEGDAVVSVDADGTFEETDVVFSENSDILRLPGSYRVGIIDAGDADLDSSNGNSFGSGDFADIDSELNTSAFNSQTSDQRSIRVIGQSLSGEFTSPINGQIALEQDGSSVEVSGSAPGAQDVLLIAVGPRGGIVTQQVGVDSDQTFDEDNFDITGLNKGAASLHIFSIGRDGRVGDADLPDSFTATTLDGFDAFLNEEDDTDSRDSLVEQDLTGDQVRSSILAQTVEDDATDDRLVNANVRLVDSQSRIVNVYQEGNEASGLNPVAAGETMVVEVQTNLKPDDNTISLEVQNEDVTVGLSAVDEWGDDGRATLTLDTEDAATGTYSVEIDDGQNSVTEEIELVEEVSTATPTPTEADDTPTATDSPTPTATASPTATEMPDTDTPTPTEGGGPGFGAVVALVALLAAALLATRRDN